MKANGNTRRTAFGLAGAALMALIVSLLPNVASAQDGTVDWRAALTCPAEHQIHEGLLYCTARHSGQIIHIIVADLSTPSIRFEYLLPQDYSQSTLRECRDPNLPANGSKQEGGCLDRDGVHYPTITLSQAIALDATFQRDKVIEHSAPLAAVINADYGAPVDVRDHGAEGLMVVRSERLDGVSRCDDDYSAALRPWLALGETVDKATGLIPSMIDRLATDSASPPTWTYTAFGGGPVLLHEGGLNLAADNCASDPPHWLQTVDPVTNCAGKEKATKSPPLPEKYGNSCYATAHTAAGLSADGRWLFLVINEGKLMPAQLASFMHDALHVQEAMKFDGGGSSTLWFNGASEIIVNPVSDVRPLSNWMAIHSPSGQGIRLPHKSTASDRVIGRVRVEGEPAVFDLRFTNTGSFTWMPDDNIGILGPGAVSFAGDPTKRHMAFKITDPTPPGKSVKYTWKEEANGLAFARFQMAQDGEPFGQDVQVIVITVPQSMKEQAEKLQKELDRIIAEAKARGEEGLKNLVEEVQKWFVKQGQDVLNSICGSATLSIVSVALVVVRRRSRR